MRHKPPFVVCFLFFDSEQDHWWPLWHVQQYKRVGGIDRRLFIDLLCEGAQQREGGGQDATCRAHERARDVEALAVLRHA